MKKCLATFLMVMIPLNLPLTLAISSKKTNTKAEVKGNKLSKIRTKIKDKATDILDSMSESEILRGEDKLSMSVILSDVKEKTGDLSQMVRLKFIFQWLENIQIQVRSKIVTNEEFDGILFNALLRIRGGAKKIYSPFSKHYTNPSGAQTELKLDSSWLDDAAGKFCFYAFVLVFFQSIGSILSNHSLDEIADRLLSKESALAVKTIQQIIDNFPNHGVIDVFSQYPTRDILASIIALSRLQKAAIHGVTKLDEYAHAKGRPMNVVFPAALSSYSIDKDLEMSHSDSKVNNGWQSEGSASYEKDLLQDLAHYSAYAHAAYGWKFGLLSGNLHLGDTKMLLRKTGVKRSDIIHFFRRSQTHLPAHFIVRDVNRKTIVLCIRGTLSAKDLLTDLCCTAEDFVGQEEEMKETEDLSKIKYTGVGRGRAHHGMLESARGVAGMTRKLIATELASKPDYNLVIVGHSLGGGVASILATLWEETFPTLKVFAYGAPCVGPINYAPTMSKSIVSVVGEGDPFSCLSLGHLADASLFLSRLCEDQDLRESILNNTKSELNDLTNHELRWCIQTMASLQKDANSEKCYPPGRVLYMKGNFFGSIDEVLLYEVDQEEIFGSLRWHPRMFDLSLHIPHRYETLLSRMWEKVNHQRSNYKSGT